MGSALHDRRGLDHGSRRSRGQSSACQISAQLATPTSAERVVRARSRSHFSEASSYEHGRDLDALAGRLRRGQVDLRVRLIADESMGGHGPGRRRRIARPVAPGDPGRSSSTTSRFDRECPTPSHVDAMAARGGRRLVPSSRVSTTSGSSPSHTDRRCRQRGASSSRWPLDDNFYVATRALRLARGGLPPGTGRCRSFAVPNRHMLLWHAIRGRSRVVGAMQAIDRVTLEGASSRSGLDH